MTGFDERGGVAAISRLDFQLADLGTLTLSGAYSSLGWGALDQRLQERAIESNYQYDISTNLELGKFIPGKTGIKIPFYYQYTTSVKTPEYYQYCGLRYSPKRPDRTLVSTPDPIPETPNEMDLA